MCFNPTYVRDPNYSSRRLAAFILPYVVPLIYRTGETTVYICHFYFVRVIVESWKKIFIFHLKFLVYVVSSNRCKSSQARNGHFSMVLIRCR